MLLDLRETVKNSKPIKYTLITVICIPFVLVGIGSYFAGGTAKPVAEVNGTPISPQQLERAYQQQRQQLARMFGGRIPEGFGSEQLLREQALQQLVTQQVLESEVVSQKFAVGDETLGRAIRSLPNFQVDGRFDKETYERQLRASGLSVEAFEQSYRDDTAMNQFRTGVASTSFVLPEESQRLSALSRQIRTIEAVRFDLDAAKEQIEVPDEDVVAYFEKNKGNYQFPERAKIQYIELDSVELAADIDITDEQAQSYYDENRLSYILPEQREVSHILLSADEGDTAEHIATLNELKSRIEAGESFAELAKEYSDDVGSAEAGGSLGLVSPGAMVAEFEEAVFALDSEGGLSTPIETQYGVHLIRLDKVIPESGKPFEDVRDEIISTLQQNEADSLFFDLREQLVETSFDNPDSLEPVVDVTGLEAKTSDWLDVDTNSGAVLSNPAVLQAVFSDEVLNEEANSDVIDVGQRHSIVLRVLEHEGPRPKSLDDVREDVIDTIKSERAAEMLKALQESALAALSEGQSASDIAKDNELATAIEQLELERNSEELDRAAVNRIFAMANPANAASKVTEAMGLNDGDSLALRLDSVNTPEDKESASEGAVAEGASEVLDPRIGNTEFEVLLEALRESADVEILSGT